MRLPLVFCAIVCALVPLSASRASAQAKKPEPKNPPARQSAASRAEAASAARFAAGIKQLTALARALKNETKPGPAYQRMSSFTKIHAKDELGARAALALGVYDFNLARYTQARAWLDRAKAETLLGDYVLYWSAMADSNLNNSASALDQLEQLRRDYPQSVITNLALQALGQAAIGGNQPQRALDAFAAARDMVEATPKLILLRGQAHEQAGDKIAAAGDYLTVYDHFPLDAQAAEAGDKANYLASTMGDTFPKPTVADQQARASTLFDARHWQDAMDTLTKLLPSLGGDDLKLAQARIEDCHAQLGTQPAAFTPSDMESTEMAAQRDFYLNQGYRTVNDEPDMLASLNDALSLAPKSQWTERTLFWTGNDYWVELARDKASSFYQQVIDRFGSSASANSDVINSRWRIAWTAYMEQHDAAASLFEKFIQDYPGASYVPDALYWLGRLAERAGKHEDARAYFQKLRDRFPSNYFTASAAAPLRTLRKVKASTLPLLDAIPPLAPEDEWGPQEPTEALPWVARSFALESIAFDDDAVLELHAGYAATHAPALLLAIARASVNAEHYSGAIVAIRSIYPELESRPIGGDMNEAWHLAYALPYAYEIRASSRRAGVDPMVVAGLIRQESAFDKKALSVKNAFGLMQVLPKTGRLIAHELHLRYSDERLFEPAFNIRVGTVYFAGLIKQFHSVEAALAAYNAGEDRVTAWQDGQHYGEVPEFVESIPFTETREYVQIVLRNAAIYRALYGGKR
ncbi:MAG TPA: transglycosylase SLT domain-containing protein [Candidatus Acidoferrales bacterium]|nr:transglycosylase SLT domain-containing protein [Candidatus Acidoferrales bacterium]